MNIIFSLLLDFRLFFFFSSLSSFLSFESMLKLSPLLPKIKSQAKPSLPESFAAAKEGKKIEVRIKYRMGQHVSYFLHSGSTLGVGRHGTVAVTMGQVLKNSRAKLRGGK